MSPFILVLALAAAPDPDTPSAAHDDTTAACAVRRLAPFMSPYGIRQTWPVMDSPPPELLNTMGSPLADMGHIADGYQQFLHIDMQARAVYVVQQGGFAGTTKVFGPLPLPCCTTPPMPAPSTTPR